MSDARENLARVEDIRIELGAQLAKLDAQAKVATEYRELEARLKQSQHMMWFAKQQDAVRLRERHATEIANLSGGFEALQAELRAAEARLEALRADHYGAGDALHDKQGAFYAANAEVTRLEQQLQFARENEGRLAQQVEQITAQVAAFALSSSRRLRSNRARRSAISRRQSRHARPRARRSARRPPRCRRSSRRSPKHRGRWPRFSSA